jgi:single-strand DNA-binding protein
MAFESNYVTMIGNLTKDPELRFTGGGAAVCSISFASNRRYKTRDGQDQEETTFMEATCWRDMAENIGESLHKGDRIIVIGRLRKRSYENKEGQTVWVTEIEADEIAPSLRWARANVQRSQGGSGGGGGGFQNAGNASNAGGDQSRGENQGGGNRSGGSGGGGWNDGGSVPPSTDEVPF